MDTCSRLKEPGGVIWKDVHVGRLRTTISGKQSIWWLRAAVRSGLWPRNLAFWGLVLRRCSRRITRHKRTPNHGRAEYERDAEAIALRRDFNHSKASD